MANVPPPASGSVTRPLLGLTALAMLLAVPARALPDDVRTIVVFGDSQELVQAEAPKLHDGFRRMIDWVLANREAENIDFVLHVGDAIQHGNRLPLRDACLGPNDACEPSYTWARNDGKRMPCDCLAPFQVARQWARFNAQWQRLDGVVPYAIVRGNHDNHGSPDTEAPLDRPGYDQHYGEDHFRAIPESGLVSSHRDTSGTSHAWRFRLGVQPVLVVGATHMFGGPGARWVEQVLAEHPGIPALALSHSFFHGLPPDPARPRRTWTQIVARHPDRFALAVSGHFSPGRVVVERVGDRPVLALRSNWQGHEGWRTGLQLVRFHGTPPTAVEVIALDPVSRRQDQRPAWRGVTWLPTTPFTLDSPAAP